MNRFRLTEPWLRMLALTLLTLSTVTWIVYDVLAREPNDAGLVARELDPIIRAIWEPVDSVDAMAAQPRAWTWGPRPVAITTETYDASATGVRELIYFDKARIDILDASANASDPWYAAGALLVSELLGSQVQFGAELFVDRAVPELAITGDVDQPEPVTYADLAPYSSVYRPQGLGTQLPPRTHAHTHAQPRVGEAVTAQLQADGTVTLNAVAESTITIGAFDAATGHNVAAPFAEWAAVQPYPEHYLLGHPLTEPYWIETQVGGESKRTLIQAFERRVLSYTADNQPGWQLESSNVGLHYRAWRGLEHPNDLALIPLASGEPFGEELVGAAQAAGLDPFMLAAISHVASQGNPLAAHANGGYGLTGLQRAADPLRAPETLLDPAINAQQAAQRLTSLLPEGTEAVDWSTTLARFYSAGEPNWDDPALNAFVADVLAAYDELTEMYPPLAAPTASTGTFGGPLSAGPAAYYDPSYDVAWWERTLRYYDSFGLITPDWQADPHGYYCVRPGYIPGERLRLTANGVTLECTIGDMVADRDLYTWIEVSGWAVELSWPTFVALGLDQNNHVQVEYPGDAPKEPPPIPPTPEPTPSPSPSPTATPAPSSTPVRGGERLPATPPPPTPTPQPPATETPPPSTETAPAVPTETAPVTPTSEATDPPPPPTATATPTTAVPASPTSESAPEPTSEATGTAPS